MRFLKITKSKEEMIKIKLKEGVEKPKYETPGASGLDVIAYDIMKVFKGTNEANPEKVEQVREGFNKRGFISLRPHEKMLFDTGIIVADMPENYEIQVRPRSGMSLKKGLIIPNQPGTIDSDYRGTIGVILFNPFPFLVKVEKGERIAQLVPKTVDKPLIEVVEEVSDTIRGESGFGSTGIL